MARMADGRRDVAGWRGFRDIVGIDSAKAKLDVALRVVGERGRQAAFANRAAGFQQLLAGRRPVGPDRRLGRRWLAKHRPDPARPGHACREATGNWGLDLADALHANGMRVSVVNPARIKAYGASELARNQTDRLDAALIARFCRAQTPAAWMPPAPHLRQLRELVRRCDARKAARVQELNRQKAGFAAAAVAASIAAHLDWLDRQIEAVFAEVRRLVAAEAALRKNLDLVRSITGFAEISAAILLAELPNIAELTPKALAAFAGLSPSERSSGASIRRAGGISRIGSERLRRTLLMCALGAKRTNTAWQASLPA